MPETSAEWTWFYAGIGGTLLLAIFYDFVMKPWSEKILERMSDPRRIKNEKKRLELENSVDLMLDFPEEVNFQLNRLTTNLVFSVTFVMSTAVFSSFTLQSKDVLLTLLFGLLFLFSAFVSATFFEKFVNNQKLLRQYRERRNEKLRLEPGMPKEERKANLHEPPTISG